jgi:hypothetical protein
MRPIYWGLVVAFSITLIIAFSVFTLHAYIISIAQIHRIILGDVIINGLTFDGGFAGNHTIAIGISGVSGKSTIYVKIGKLPYSFGSSVTIYNYGSDWLELSVERG